MKLNIKVRLINENLVFPEIIKKGDWIDLRASENVSLEAPKAGILKRNRVNKEIVSHRTIEYSSALIPLGVAMELPKGFEAIVASRSSIYDNYGIILANSIGIIDYPYRGDNDEWKFNAIALRKAEIKEGDRICQFRIVLSQKATVWQKLKWMLCSGIKLTKVEHLKGKNRGGHGTTGKK